MLDKLLELDAEVLDLRSHVTPELTSSLVTVWSQSRGFAKNVNS